MDLPAPAQAARDEAREAELRAAATRLRGTVDIKQIEAASSDARQANELIDRRTFSWTELFNRIEATLPPEVMITSVRPDIRDEVVSVALVVVGRRIEDIDTFIENLEATHAFQGVLSSEVEATEDGMYRADLRGRYVAVAPQP